MRKPFHRRAFALVGLFLPAACGDSSKDTSPQVPDPPGTCAEWADELFEDCPTSSGNRDANVTLCERELGTFVAIGCGQAYERYLTCSRDAVFDCADLSPPDCEDERDAYFACQEEFGQRTGCFHSNTTTMCDGFAQTPNYFSCSSGMPPFPSCVSMTDGTSSYFCCPT